MKKKKQLFHVTQKILAFFTTQKSTSAFLDVVLAVRFYPEGFCRMPAFWKISFIH